MTSGDIVEQVGGAFHISQSAVSQQLKVLRDNGFARVRADGRRRFYALDPTPLMAVDAWVARYRTFWEDALSDLDVEIERGKADRRSRSN